MDADHIMESRLVAALSRSMPDVDVVERLRPLSGGAIQETWAFDAVATGSRRQLILRRARGTLRADRRHGIDLATEAAIVTLAESAGVPVPAVRLVLTPEDMLGDGFVMDFVEGETIPRRILRDAAYAEVRNRLAEECGGILAAIHRIDFSRMATIEPRQPRVTIERIHHDYRALNAPSPVFELAFRWLRERMPADLERLSLVHGDFRNGNLLVGPERLRAVLDWEGAHAGDPHEDLGYLCIPSWRFGELDQPVGGFGTREALFDAYERAGGAPVDPARARFWEVAFTLGWGVQCGQMAEQFLTGVDASVERGAIGRRRSETELDLLRFLDGDDANA